MIKKNRSMLYISLTIIFIISVFVLFFSLRVNGYVKSKENEQKKGLQITFQSSQHV